MTVAENDKNWRVLLWCLVAFVLAAHVAQFASLPSYFRDYARLPFKWELIQERGPLRYRVVSIGAQALPAGVDLRAGDILRPVTFPRSEARQGQAAKFVVLTRGAERTVEVAYVAKQAPPELVAHDIVWPIVQCLELVLGVILVRSRTAGKPALALATAMILMATPDDLLYPLPTDALAAWKFVALLTYLYPFGVAFLALFAYQLARPLLSPREQAFARLSAWLLPLASSVVLLMVASGVTGHFEPLADPAFALLWVVLWVVVVWLLLTAMRRSVGDSRVRFLSLLLPTGFLLAAYVFWNIYAWWLGNWTYTGGLITALVIFASLVALTVSLLRHRVIEIRVAVSRTLVYSVVSALLVLVFAVVEIASDKLLHFEDRQKNILLDASVALLIILAFRRVHHLVGRGVEKTLFRPWHLAQEQLRNFERDAEFITNADVLRGRLIQALARFTNATASPRLFHFVQGNHFEEWRPDHSPGPVINENVAWLVAMRATLRPIQATVADTDIPGVIAMPMLRTGRLTGFVVCAAKRHQESYRSDEIAAIEQVMSKVALDLESLRAIEAEARLKELETALADAKAEVTLLRASMPRAQQTLG